MLKVRIPTRDYAAFRDLLATDVAKLRSVAVALRERGVVPHVNHLLEGVEAAGIDDPSSARSLVQLLLTFVGLRLEHDASVEDTLGAVRAALSSLEPEAGLSLASWKDREAEIAKLVVEPAVVVVQKAYELHTAYANFLLESRVITDIRPVFDETGEQPLAATVSHTLRLTVLDGEDERVLTISIGDTALTELTNQCERAARKASVLRTSLRQGLQLVTDTPNADEVGDRIDENAAS